MDSDGARWGFRGAACCVLILTVVGSLYFQFSVSEQNNCFQGSTLGGREEAPKVGPPSRVILAAHPKTGSTTLFRAIHSRALAEGRQQTVSRVHYPYDRKYDKANHYVMQSLHNCTASNWCLSLGRCGESFCRKLKRFKKACSTRPCAPNP